MMHSTTDTGKTVILFSYAITLHISTFVTTVKTFIDSSQIEFMRHAVEI